MGDELSGTGGVSLGQQQQQIDLSLMELGSDNHFRFASTFMSLNSTKVGVESSTAGEYRALVLPLSAEYFTILKILLPCRRRHLAVMSLISAAMEERCSAGMVCETREDELEV
jgi:hypothetical protein